MCLDLNRALLWNEIKKDRELVAALAQAVSRLEGCISHQKHH